MVTAAQATAGLESALALVLADYSGSKPHLQRVACKGDGVGNETFACSATLTERQWPRPVYVHVVLGRIHGHQPPARMYEDLSGIIRFAGACWTVDRTD